MADKKSFYSDVSELTFPSLIYPNDMSAANFYPDCVCFTIQKRTGVSIANITSALGAGVAEGKRRFTNKLPPELKKNIENAIAAAHGKISDEEAEQTAIEDYKKAHPDHTISENLKDVISGGLRTTYLETKSHQQAALQAEKDGTNILGSIYLNMPNGIQFNEAANWSGDSLGFMGKTTRDIVSGQGGVGETAMGALAGSAGNIVGAAVGAIPSLVSKLGISGGMFGAAIGAMAAGGPMQSGMESALGVAQNPYMEMMFSGVGFRKFQFEFILRPKSSDEVNEVAEILNTIRTFTKPTFTEGALHKTFMDYPMEFKIEFLTWAQNWSHSSKATHDVTGEDSSLGGNYMQNPHVPRLKNCVCDNVTSNFTPQSIWAAHDEGAPVAVNLSLSFQETELVMAEDVYHMEY